jgi:hypothetical protein
MKVGDLVFDHNNGLHGVVVKIEENETPYRGKRKFYDVLYEDSVIDSAEFRELEVISESR